MRSLLRFLLFVLTPVAIAAPDFDPDPKDSKYRALLVLCAHSVDAGNAPPTGFDCGELVAYVFQRAWGLALPPQVDQQAKLGKRVSRHALELGDLVFYNTEKPFSHVGIYIGDRHFTHAPKRGQPIRFESMDHPYWAARFSGARRVNPPV